MWRGGQELKFEDSSAPRAPYNAASTGLLDAHADAFPERLPVHPRQTEVRIARAVLPEAGLSLAEDFALREILGGEEAGASSDCENK